MALSDGGAALGPHGDHAGRRRLLVSDSTERKVHELDTATGKKLGEFARPDQRQADQGGAAARSTNSADGRYYFVSASKDDQVVVLDYATEKVLTRIDVDDHPQRMRMAVVRRAYLNDAEGDGDVGAGDDDRGAGSEPDRLDVADEAYSGPVLPATGGGALVPAVVAVAAGAAAWRWRRRR